MELSGADDRVKLAREAGPGDILASAEESSCRLWGGQELAIVARKIRRVATCRPDADVGGPPCTCDLKEEIDLGLNLRSRPCLLERLCLQ